LIETDYNRSLVLTQERTKLHQISAGQRSLVGTPEILLDFRYFAPLRNYSDSNATLRHAFLSVGKLSEVSYSKLLIIDNRTLTLMLHHS